MKNKHLIYFNYILNINSGGPSGYLANLKKGLELLNDSSIDFFVQDGNKDKQSKLSITNWFKNNKIIKYLKINYLSRDGKKLLNYYINFNNIEVPKELIEKIKHNNYKTIHCHLVFDALILINTIKKIKIPNPPKILLTTHSPESIVFEIIAQLKALGYSKKNISRIAPFINNIEKEALSNSDILIFPSEEAMEPYYETIDYFKDFIKTKHVEFIQTGSKQLATNKSKEDLKKQFNIEPDKKIIVYIGRHNEVKGYDLLVKVGEEILKNRDDIVFLIGGVINPEIPYPKHKNWIELGWVNSAEVISIADLFILPNKRTYFDLVMLEVMSMGVPIIASNTGGNKTIKTNCNSIILFNNTKDNLLREINDFFNLDSTSILDIKNKILQTYLNNYTLEYFASRYVKLVEKIHNIVK